MKRLLLICLLLTSLPLMAGQKTLSRATYQSLEQSQQLLEAGNAAKAIAQLQALVKETSERPYDHAVVLQTLAHAYISQGKYRPAVSLLERSLKLAVLPADAQQRLRHNLAQLYLATDKLKPAIAMLRQWLELATEQDAAATADVYAMLGSAHLQLQAFSAAVGPLQKAIELSPKPRENWYQALLGAHHELKDYPACAQLLHRMIVLFPESPRYWQQLAGIELSRERYAEALAVLELAWQHGHLDKQRPLIQLARLYLHRAEPYKAAQLLETEIAKGRIKSNCEHWQLTADAWYQARETTRSIAALEKARKAGAKADAVVRLARLYLEDGHWQRAGDTLGQVLKDRQLPPKLRGDALLLLGISHYEGKAIEDARLAFREAGKFKSSREDAQQWLAYLDNDR